MEGDLYYLMLDSREWDNNYQWLKDLIKDEAWNEQVIFQLFLVEIADHIIQTVRIPERRGGIDSLL